MDGVVSWLALNDNYLSLIVPVSFVSTLIVIVVVACVVCRRRPCASKPASSAPALQSQPQQPRRGDGPAPTTSSVTATTYLPGAVPSTSNGGHDEYTRCFVAARRLDASWNGSGSPSLTTHCAVAAGPTASSSSPLVSGPPPALRSDVKYRFYDEC